MNGRRRGRPATGRPVQKTAVVENGDFKLLLTVRNPRGQRNIETLVRWGVESDSRFGDPGSRSRRRPGSHHRGFSKTLGCARFRWAGTNPASRRWLRGSWLAFEVLIGGAAQSPSPTQPLSPAPTCYPQGTMSAINGDKARFHRIRKQRLALRERSQILRKQAAARSLSPVDEPVVPPAKPPIT